MAAPSTTFKPFAVLIKNHYVPTYSLRLMIDCDDITVGKLKTQIEKEHKGNPRIEDQLLVYRGKLLESKLKLSSLFQSSIIISPSSNTEENDTETVHTICIHMTLRGGSSTATKIGLTVSASFDGIPVPTNTKLSKSESDLKANLNEQHVEQQQEEEKQQPPSTSSTVPNPATIPPQFVHVPPPHYPPYYSPYHPPPPNPYYFSQSMPNLMHPAYLQRTQSAPSHPFHPPTLVQQSSHTQQQYPPYIAPPPHVHYAPYGAIPPPPHAIPPLAPYAPPFTPFMPHSQSMSDLNTLRQQTQRTFIPSKIEEKEEKKESDDNNTANRMNNTFGLRQRRVVNNNDDNARAANNNVNNDNNQIFNNNVNVNNNAAPQGDRWFVRVFRALNINVLIRLGIFMWFFGPNLGTYRFTILCIVGALYYFHQVGLLQRLFGNIFARGNGNVNEPRHRDPHQENNNESQEEAPPPLLPLTYVQLLQRFLIGIVASLWPTWDHTTLYPVPQ